MSAPDAVVVLARWQAAPDAVGEVLSLVAQLRRDSLAEPGCLEYDAFQRVDEPGAVLLVERYADDAALDAHRRSTHYQALVVGRILPMLASRRVELFRGREPA